MKARISMERQRKDKRVGGKEKRERAKAKREITLYRRVNSLR